MGCRIAGKRRNFIHRLTGPDVPTIKNSELSSDTEGIKMPTIDENRIFTAIIEWEVSPEQQQALIDGIADEVEQHFKRYAGFVSASFHASEDGRRVINYGQWRSKEDWSRARTPGNDEATAAIAEVISRCGAKSVKVDTFRVARVVENAFTPDAEAKP
jgi:hypothetical protein